MTACDGSTFRTKPAPTARLRYLIALFATGLLPAQTAQAQLPSNVQVHGFLSQAYILTSDNDFFGNSDDSGSWDFAELGLNASWQPIPDLQIAAQGLSRHAGEGHDGELRLDYGLIDYRFSSSPEHDLGMRLGRIKNPFGLYNETRDVAFTRPSIILPQSIYFDRTRNLALSADGGQLYGEHRSGNDNYHWQFNVALPQVDDKDTELGFLGADRPGDLKDRTSYIGRLLYEHDGGRLMLAVTTAQLNLSYRDDPAGTGDIRFIPTIVSAQYNAENWSVTSEYAQRRFRFDDGIVYVPASLRRTTGESYYLQGSYHFDPRWKALLRYDVTYLNRDDRDGEKLEALTGGLRPAHSQFAKDRTVGLEWSPNRNWLVRLEHHWVDGTAWLPIQDNLGQTTTGNWRMFALQVSFGF